MFKSFLKLACSWLVVFGIAYLLGSFNQGSFNSSLWEKDVRETVTILSTRYIIFSFVLWLLHELTN
jgi:hypothetical protein